MCHGEEAVLGEVDVRVRLQECGEFRGEVGLVLLGVAEEGGAGALDADHGLGGKAQGRGVARLDCRTEEPALLESIEPGRLVCPIAVLAAVPGP